jgi:amino acid adenylation domain-containing protein
MTSAPDRSTSSSVHVLDLPTDYPRRRSPARKVAMERAEIPADLHARLTDREAADPEAPAAIFAAAFAVLVGRLTGAGEVWIATPGGRAPVLRLDLSADPTWRDLCAGVRAEWRQSAAGQAPAVPIAFEIHQPERGRPCEPDAAGDRDTCAAIDPSRELTWSIVYTPERTRVRAIYDARVFARTRVAEMLRQYILVLSAAACDPGQRMSGVSLVTEPARGVLPDPTAPLSAAWEGAVCERFRARARQTPEAVAVFDPSGQWTYRDVDVLSSRVARALRAAGIAPGEVVAISGHRSAGLVPALLGVMKAGAAFLVLDLGYPIARLEAYVDAAGPAAWIGLDAAGPHDRALAHVMASRPLRARMGVPACGDALDAPAAEPDDPDIALGPESPAYIAFTSGSTGRPKAVLGAHGSLTHFVPWQQQAFGLTAADRFSMLSGLAHDPLHRDVFLPLQIGATIGIPPPEDYTDPHRLAAWLRASGITVANMTPGIARLVSMASGAPPVASLRRAFVVGDVFTREDARRLEAVCPNVHCVNYYGATETQQALGYFEVPRASGAPSPDAGRESGAVLPLGAGMPDVQLLVVNAPLGLAGVGEVGEICFRSPHLARGYVDDAALTRARFITNPFTGDPRDRVYRTGDLGRYRPDGLLEFVGRADQQVKIRGYRVEPGEIEAALAQCDGVDAALVVAREERPGEKYLVGYVVSARAQAPSAAELRRFLRDRLPDHMVPSFFVNLRALPLTANGKIDRRALPPPERTSPHADASPHAATPVERELAAIWASALGRPHVDRDASFFDLGGHSLVAAQILAQVRDTFQVDLPMRSFFAHPSVAALAGCVTALRQQGGTAAADPVERVDRRGELPLSFNQEGRLFLERWARAHGKVQAPLHATMGLRLRGPLNRPALERALNGLIARHEALRTSFDASAATVRQSIADTATLQLSVADLEGLSDAARHEAWQRLVRDDCDRPFDYARPPLMRATLARHGPLDHTLLIVVHHLLCDDWSLQVLRRDLEALYAAEGQPLPAVGAHAVDFAGWQRATLTHDRRDRLLEYWKTRWLDWGSALVDIRELPFARPAPEPRGSADRQTLALDAGLSDALRRFASAHNATIYMFFLAALGILLRQYTGHTRIAVWGHFANRPRAAFAPLVGWCANAHILGFELESDPCAAAAIDGVRDTVLAAQAHEEMPMWLLASATAAERRKRRGARGDFGDVPYVSFDVRHEPVSTCGGLEIAPVVVERATAEDNLNIIVLDRGATITLQGRYHTDRFLASDIRSMLGDLKDLAQAMTVAPGTPVSGLARHERRQVAEAFWHAARLSGRAV